MSALQRTTREYDPPLTVDEFERLPEGEGKQELHDGRVVEMAPVGGAHGVVVIALGIALGLFVRAQGGRAYGRVTTETGYVLWPGRRESRAPDLAFIRADRAPRPWPRRLVRAVPDLAVEVLSPNDQAPDVLVKVREYLDAGVPLVWVLDPGREAVVYAGSGVPFARLGPDDVLDGGAVLPGFRLPLAELWAELEDVEDDEADGSDVDASG